MANANLRLFFADNRGSLQFFKLNIALDILSDWDQSTDGNSNKSTYFHRDLDLPSHYGVHSMCTRIVYEKNGLLHRNRKCGPACISENEQLYIEYNQEIYIPYGFQTT